MSDWELVEFFEDDRLELYNLRTDLREKRDIASAMPKKVTELHQTMLAWRADTKALMPSRKGPAAPRPHGGYRVSEP